MTLPSVDVEFVEEGAIVVPANAADVCLHVGACSAGALNTLFGFKSYAAAQAVLGVGPLLQAVAADIQLGLTAYAMRTTGTAGAQGSWTHTGSGPAVGSTGTPLDSFRVRVKIMTGGVRGTATFAVSIDGGKSYGNTIVTAATYAGLAAATGLTLTFASGTYVKDEVYSSDSAAPYYQEADVLDTLDAAFADPREWGIMHLVGAPANESNLASLAGSVGSSFDSAEQSLFRYTSVLLEAPAVADSALVAAFASFASNRVSIAAGDCEFVSPIDKKPYRRNIAFEATGKIVKAPISQSLGKVGRGGNVGRMNGRVQSLYRDENATPGLDAARFITSRTLPGMKGFFFTRGRIMADPSSRYNRLQIRRVADEGARAARIALLSYLEDDVLTDPQTGTILPSEAADIDANVLGAAESALKGHASAVEFAVSRDDNIAAEDEPLLTGELSFIPKKSLERISLKVGARSTI